MLSCPFAGMPGNAFARMVHVEGLPSALSSSVSRALTGLRVHWVCHDARSMCGADLQLCDLPPVQKQRLILLGLHNTQPHTHSITHSGDSCGSNSRSHSGAGQQRILVVLRPYKR